MRSRKREVNIFNMSVLDLLTGALGAFCFLTLALFPSYYGNHAHERALAKTEAALKQAEKQENKIRNQVPKPKPAPAPPNGMPRFALVSLGSNTMNVAACASLKLQSVEVPPGSPSVDYLAGVTFSPGRVLIYDLFVRRVGLYHVVVDATPILPNCNLVLGIQAAHGRQTSHKLTGAGLVHLDFQITRDDFAQSLFQ